MVASLAEAKSHNVPPAIIQSYWRQIREAKRAQDDANAGLARVKKAAKGAGIEMSAIKTLEGLSKMDDDVLEVHLNKTFEYASALGMPFAKQLSMFATSEAPAVSDREMEEHKTWEAGDQGLKAGRDGEPASANPWPLGSAGYVAWSKQHAIGLGERMTAESMDSTESERPADVAAATKRGRKPGTGKAVRKPTVEHQGALN